MKLARISLIDYFATDLVLGTNHAFSPEHPVQFEEKDFVVTPAVRKNETAPGEDRHWQVTLEIRHQPAPGVNFPYSYRVVLVGQFGVHDGVQSDDEERFVRIQGASVLYGMAREIVRALTGRGPYRPVILPTVSFYEQKTPPSAPAAVSPEGPASASGATPLIAPAKKPARSKATK
jgi:preprotein translocase subunit SecB